RHVRVSRVEGLDGVLEVRKTGTGGGVRPERQRDLAVSGRATAAAGAASGAGGGGKGDAKAERGDRRSTGFLRHRRNSLSETCAKTCDGSSAARACLVTATHAFPVTSFVFEG